MNDGINAIKSTTIILKLEIKLFDISSALCLVIYAIGHIIITSWNRGFKGKLLLHVSVVFLFLIVAFFTHCLVFPHL